MSTSYNLKSFPFNQNCHYYTFVYLSSSLTHKWLDEFYCSFSAVIHAPHLQWYIPPSCSVTELSNIRINIMSFLFLLHIHGDPLTMSFSRIWRNNELTRREGSRQESENIKQCAEGCSCDGETLCTLNVAPWRSSWAAFPQQEGF